LAVIVLVLIALFSAPVTNVSTQPTQLGRKFAVASHCLHARFADVDALSAAARAIIVALFRTHGFQAFGASDHALLASVDAGVVTTHIFSLSVLGNGWHPGNTRFCGGQWSGKHCAE